MSNKKSGGILLFLLSFAACVGLDQWTKALAEAHLMNQEPITLIPGVFELRYLENRGAAFGMLQGQQLFFFIIAIVVFAAVIYCFFKLPFSKRFFPLWTCLMLISAGAAGNMIDRVTQKYVVDFLYFSLIDFPIFNVADCYVTVAAFLLIVLIMWFYREDELSVLSLKKGA